MKIQELIIFIGCLGAIGGITNCAITGEFALPKIENNSWRPGWIGNVLIGTIAAIVIAGMYGPIAGYDVIKNTGLPESLKISEITGAIIIGIGGGNILTQLSRNQAGNITKNNLIDFSEELIEIINETIIDKYEEEEE